MTLDEALAELGIERGIDSDGARRAYLRLLKTRKPETDPEGFMRLREAYELVKARLPLLEARRPREPEVAAARVEVPAVNEVPAVDLHVAAVDLEVAAVDLPAPAIDEVPPAPAAEPVVAPDLGDVGLMNTLLARGAYRKAAKQALLILAAATARLDAPDPPVASCLRLALGLHQIAAPAKAREVSAALAAWLAASGQESAQVQGHRAVLWALVRELNRMKKGLPDRVRAAIASAALAGDLARARADLVLFHSEQPAAGQAAGGLLRREAPVIGAALADALDPPAPRPRQDISMKGWGVLMFVALGFVRLIISSGREASDPPLRSHPTPSYTTPTLSFDAGDVPSVRREALRQNIRIRGNTLWTITRPSGRLKPRAAAVVVALDTEDCTRLVEAMEDLRAESASTSETSEMRLESMMDPLAADIALYCEGRVDAGVRADSPEGAGDQGSGREGERGK